MLPGILIHYIIYYIYSFLNNNANLSVVSISFDVTPNSVDEWPANKIMCNSASGHN